ncbi:hypothetical protein vseg_003130 [Gypsophila vaccaria]
MNITTLPQDCLVLILSRTSPRDVLRSSVVSKHFFSASNFDTVWENFLPADYRDIISQSCSPVSQFQSKKHLFLHLCHNPIFLHNNTQNFGLDKWKGKKCYTLGARALQIAWGKGDTPWYWRFESIPDSRFPEVAVLESVFWLEVKGRIHVNQLSPDTTYGAYLVFKMISNDPAGFGRTPVKATVLEVDEDDEGPPRNNSHRMDIKSYYLQTVSRRAHSRRVRRAPGEVPFDRGDGWMEVELGRYRVGHIDKVSSSHRDVVEMTLWEAETGGAKTGLVVQCIDLRPLD